MTMTIGEVAKIAGVATSTLRYYEDIGLIDAPIRVNKQRRYDDAVLPILALIQLAKDSQFTLDEIKELLYDFPDDVPLSHRWQIIAERKIDEIERVIRQAQETKQLLNDSISCQYLHFELNDVLPEIQ